MKNQHTSDHHIVINDTFCGWCCGAAPVFDAVAQADPGLEVLQGFGRAAQAFHE